MQVLGSKLGSMPHELSLSPITLGSSRFWDLAGSPASTRLAMLINGFDTSNIQLWTWPHSFSAHGSNKALVPFKKHPSIFPLMPFIWEHGTVMLLKRPIKSGPSSVAIQASAAGNALRKS